MVEVVTQQQAREVRDLDFCYICGDPFTNKRPATRDHVPPRSIFLQEDRNWPLILPAHSECNSEYSFSDEQAAGLIHLLHPTNTGQFPLNTRPVGIVVEGDTPKGILLEGLPLPLIVHRILRACHAALYCEYLPTKTRNMIQLPLPIFDPKTGNVAKETRLPQNRVLCKLLKDNRRLSRVDRIQAYNGKFRFDVAPIWLASPR